MSGQYPIWNKIIACIYEQDKSYGAIDHNTHEIFVGSSNKNKQRLAKVEVKREVHFDIVSFTLYIDNKQLRTINFRRDEKGKATDYLETINYPYNENVNIYGNN